MKKQIERVSSTASLFDLTGKVAMVTGATGRLGREICFALAEMGADLVVTARTESSLYELKHDLEDAAEVTVLPIAADAQHEKPIHGIFDKTLDMYGKLDILVNVVTGNSRLLVDEMTEDEWSKTLHGTVTGIFLSSQAAGRIMQSQGGGSIINIASIYGIVAADQRIYGDSGLNSSVVYGTGKAAVIQLTRYLAAFWGDKGIRVNCITPGGVEDASNEHPTFRTNYQNRTPVCRMMKREEIRGPVVFLASDASSYVTGHNLVVDGGFTII